MFYKQDDILLHYLSIGEGVPVLILHGLTCDHRLMTACLEPVFTNKKGLKRIYIDLPGMGKSGNNIQYASSDAILNILIGFIGKEIGKAPFIIIGESYGGYLSMGILSKFHTQILGMCLICPMVNPKHSTRKLPRKSIIVKDEEFLKILPSEEKDDFLNIAVVATQATYQRYNNEVKTGNKLMNLAFVEEVVKNYQFSFELYRKLNEIKFDKPVLILSGKQDNVVGYEDLWEVSKHYERLTFLTLDIAGHNLQIDQPEIFNVMVENWLTHIR